MGPQPDAFKFLVEISFYAGSDTMSRNNLNLKFKLMISSLMKAYLKMLVEDHETNYQKKFPDPSRKYKKLETSMSLTVILFTIKSLMKIILLFP